MHGNATSISAAVAFHTSSRPHHRLAGIPAGMPAKKKKKVQAAPAKVEDVEVKLPNVALAILVLG